MEVGEIKKNYHWLIAAALLLQLFLIGGIYNNLSNLFMLPVTESLKIARSSFALAVSMKGLASFVSTFFSGALLHRFGYRKMVSLLMLTNSIALVIMATGKNVAVLGLGFGIMGLGDGICLNAGPPRVVRHWFHKHQGLVLGCVSAATGLGGSAMCLFVSGMIEKCGWQGAFLCCAALYSVMAVVLFALIRNRPEDIGLKPFGEGQFAGKKKENVRPKWEGFSWTQLLRRPAFYLTVLACFLTNCCIYSLSQNLVPHIRSIGFSNAQAVTVQSVFMLLLAVSKLGAGVLCDRIGGKRITLICLGCATAGLGIMSVSQNYYLVWASVVLLSFGLPLTIMTVPLLAQDLFGYQAQTMAVGVLMSTSPLAILTASTLSNGVFDRLGSYCPVYVVATLMALVLLGLYGVIYLMVHRDKKKLSL